MRGELVSVLTSDKVRLDGFFCMPTNPSKQQHKIDGAILVHGLSGNFYQSRLLKHFAKSLLDADIPIVIVNTRGHDYLHAAPRMGRTATLGAAVEVIDECRFDLEAWAQFMVSQGCESTLLLGHSLGAIKSLYAQAHQPLPKVSGIAAFSATKLSTDSLSSSSKGDRFRFWLEQSNSLRSSDRGDELMFVDFPFPTWMSANAYHSKYGDGDKYNWLSFMNQITVPTLATFGTIEMEDNPSFKVMKPELEAITQSNFEIAFVERADHFYSACFEAASDILMGWLNRIQA